MFKNKIVKDVTQHGEKTSVELLSSTHICPVTKGSVEGLFLWTEQISDVTEAGDLEHLWLLLNHFSVRKRETD